jgi:hypothetical protein
MELVSLTEYQRLSPFKQGYIHYMQADLDGSQLKNSNNPHEVGTRRYNEWNLGQTQAMLDVQDSEE